MNPKELKAQAKALYDEAETLATAGHIDDAKAKEAEADALIEKANSLQSLADKKAALNTPTKPADLPDDSTDPATPPKQPDYAKTVYTMRYGEMEPATEAVMKDLHGPNYHQLRVDQQKAFIRYLRRYDRPPNREDEVLLSQIILTPEYAQKAIQDGMDVDALKSTMVEGIGSLGGYAVPVDFQATVITRLQGLVTMRGKARAISTTRDRVELPKATGGDDQYSSAVRVTWVDETPTAGTSETNLTLGLESIPVHTVMAETPISRNLVEDSAVNLVDLLTQMFAEASAIDEDNKFLVGDGTGKPQGILPGGLNANSLGVVNSGDAATITFGATATTKGLIGLTYGVAAQYRQNAKFWGERGTYNIIAHLVDGNGQYLWRDMFGQNSGVGGAGTQKFLLGYEVLEQEALPTVAANAFPVIFGDPMGYTIVDRVGMTVERYLDSQTARQNLVYYVMRRRLGGQLTEPWRFNVMQIAA